MEKSVETVSGNIVDIVGRRVFPGVLEVSDGRIAQVVEQDCEYGVYIVPGFVDSHVHVESSMLTPSEFGRVAVVHGTVAVVSDPHEIGNVLGVSGVKYMIEDGSMSPLKFYFGAPSCVPATFFETSGAVIGAREVDELLQMDEIKYLGEVMNFPGVIGDDPEVIEKIEIARGYSKLVDGHAPMLGGEELRKYAGFGISTDHECTTEAEALEKIGAGMMIQIREGSAARNFDDLISIIDEHHESCMFCSDDKHPDDLLGGHIRDLVKRAVNYGVDVMKVLQVASLNPVLHYGLDVGMLRAGDPADFLVIDNLDDFNVLKTYIDGNLVADGKRTLVPRRSSKIVNNFKAREKRVEEFALPYTGKTGIERMNVIEAIENQIITEKTTATPTVVDGYVVSDTARDILKIAVLNRYEDKRPAIGFVKNFNLREGAIASSVAHDSHNIIAVGATDEEICRAVNLVIRESGGISAVSRETEAVLPLPIAGIMSNEDYATVAEKYTRIDRIAKELGSTLHAPFMTLSFMALLVIPKLKLSDKGLFDVEKFEFVDLFE